MATRSIHASIRAGANVAPGSTSYLLVSPRERAIIDDSVVLPVGKKIPLDANGEAVFDLELTPEDGSWAWRIEEIVNGARTGKPRDVLVDEDSAEYADLAPADPSTSPDAAWGPTALAAKQARDEAVAAAAEVFVRVTNTEGEPITGRRVVITVNADTNEIEDITTEAVS